MDFVAFLAAGLRTTFLAAFLAAGFFLFAAALAIGLSPSRVRISSNKKNMSKFVQFVDRENESRMHISAANGESVALVPQFFCFCPVILANRTIRRVEIARSMPRI